MFSPQGACVFDETPLKPVGCIELKRENRTSWMDLPRANAGNPVIEEERQEASSSTDPVMQDNQEAPVARARKPPPGPTTEELGQTRTHARCVPFFVQTLFRVGHGKIHIDASQHTRVGPKVTLGWVGCYSRVIKNRVFNCLCWLFTIFPLVR